MSIAGVLAVGRTDRSVNLQVSFYDKNDNRQRPAGIYTVQFGIQTPDGLYKKVNPTARVVWSVEGNTIQRRLSVYDGASISGVADHVAVRVTDDSQNVGAGFGLLTSVYTVTVEVTPFPRPPRGMPPYLRGSDDVIVVAGGGAGTNIAVPDDAGVISACAFAVAAGGGLPRITQVAADPAVILARYVPATDSSSWTPIHPQTLNLTLENVSADPLSTVTYNVLWGIDG